MGGCAERWVVAVGSARKVYCLVEAPDADTTHDVHCKARGLVAAQILAVVRGALRLRI
jgi:hypothetical protein